VQALGLGAIGRARTDCSGPPEVATSSGPPARAGSGMLPWAARGTVVKL
jgi:hypothetical protein